MRDFLESPALLCATRSPVRRLFYHDLAPRLTDRDASTRPLCLPERSGAAHRPRHALPLLDRQRGLWLATGVRATKTSIPLRRRGRFVGSSSKDVCPTCVHDQSGTWSPALVLGEILNQNMLGRGVALGLRTSRLVARSARAGLPRSLRERSKGNAYPRHRLGPDHLCRRLWGEHVGDAAILGGALLRISRPRDRARRYRKLASAPHGTMGRLLAATDSGRGDFQLASCSGASRRACRCGRPRWWSCHGLARASGRAFGNLRDGADSGYSFRVRGNRYWAFPAAPE